MQYNAVWLDLMLALYFLLCVVIHFSDYENCTLDTDNGLNIQVYLWQAIESFCLKCMKIWNILLDQSEQNL